MCVRPSYVLVRNYMYCVRYIELTLVAVLNVVPCVHVLNFMHTGLKLVCIYTVYRVRQRSLAAQHCLAFFSARPFMLATVS